MDDDRLRLIFTCCHPALALPARVALTLRLLGGLRHRRDRPRVPRARGDDGAADRAREGQDPRRPHPVPRAPRRRPARPPARRARRRLPGLHRGPRDGGDGRTSPPRRSGSARLLARADARRARGARAARRSCCSPRPAGRRGRRPTARGCCSPTRTASRWDRALVDEGLDLVRRCLRRDRPGPYQVQAAINAVHAPRPTPRRPTGARSSRCTTSCSRWRRARWSRSTARSRWPRPRGRPPRWRSSTRSRSDWSATTSCHAVRADLLRRLGRDDEADRALEAALARTDDPDDRALLAARRGRG